MIAITFPGARGAFAALLLCGAAASIAQAPLAPGDPAERLSGYMRTLAGDPGSVVALVGAGRAALEIGDVNGALGFYGRASQAAPQNGEAKAGLAAALVQLEQPRRALPLFAQAAQLGVPAAAIAADRGLAYDLIGDGASAQRDYATALEASDNDETRRRYALSLGIGGQREKALGLLDPLVRRRDPAGWRARAFVLALTGDTGGADSIVEAMMPSQSAAMQPFLRELASLTPAQKAAAVNFGDMPSAGAPGGAGTQLAARDPTPLPNPMPAPAPRPVPSPAAGAMLVPAGAPLGQRVVPALLSPVRVAAMALPSSPRTATAMSSPATVAAAPSAPSPVPANPPIPLRPASQPLVTAQSHAAVPTAAMTRPVAGGPAPRPIAIVPRPEQVAPPAASASASLMPAAPDVPAPGPERTAAAVAPPPAASGESRPSSSGAVDGPASPPGLIGPPAPVTAPTPTPTAYAPPRSATPIATVALPPSAIAAPSPDRLAAAEGPPARRPALAEPAGEAVEPGRVGPFRTVARKEIEERRTQLAAADGPAGRPRSDARAEATKNTGKREDADVGSKARSKDGTREEGETTSSKRPAGTKIAAADADGDAMARKSRPVKSRSADRDDEPDATPSKGKSSEAKSAKASDDEDAKTSPAGSISRHGRVTDDADAKPSSKKGKAAEDNTAKPASRKGKPSAADARSADDDTSTKGARVYVQVAGGANKDDMPKAWAGVKKRAPELMKGRSPTTTPLRFTNRLLVGPFKDADEAQTFVNKLAGKGMSGTVFTSAKGQKIEKVPAAK